MKKKMSEVKGRNEWLRQRLRWKDYVGEYIIEKNKYGGEF